MVLAIFSSRKIVLPETDLPVCCSIISALMSSVRFPLSDGSSARRRSASMPRASVAYALSVTVSERTK